MFIFINLQTKSWGCQSIEQLDNNWESHAYGCHMSSTLSLSLEDWLKSDVNLSREISLLMETRLQAQEKAFVSTLLLAFVMVAYVVE